MNKLQSLADYLGVLDPVKPGAPVVSVPDFDKLTPKRFCQDLLNTVQYRESLLRRIILDELPPAVELWFLNTAHGKPTERVEFKDTTDPLDDFTPDQLEDRALRLLEHARQLRTNDEVHQPSDDGPTPSAVH